MIVGLILRLIRFYMVATPSYLRGNCRFRPTCSQYSYEAFERFGFFGGLCLSVKRLLKCNPFYGSYINYDPVIKHNKHNECIVEKKIESESKKKRKEKEV